MTVSYEFKMQKETKSSIITKQFNGHEIYTNAIDKMTGHNRDCFEGLHKYSLTAKGYRNQLLLMGYKEVKL